MKFSTQNRIKISWGTKQETKRDSGNAKESLKKEVLPPEK